MLHSIQERQAPPHFAPLRPVEFFDRRGDLSCGPRAIVQATIRPEQLQRRLNPFPCPLRTIITFHQPFDLFPGFGRRCPKTTAVAATVGFFRPRPLRFQAIPELSQHPLRFLLGVKDIQAHLQGSRVSGVLPLFLEIDQPSLEPTPAIHDRWLQSVEPLQRFGPCRAAAVRGMLCQHPRHAVRLHAHQDRFAVEEYLVETTRDHQRTTRLIQAIEDSACRLRTGLHPSRDLRPAGTFFLTTISNSSLACP